MQSSSHELNTPVADSVHKITYLQNLFTHVEISSVVGYSTGVKSVGFPSNLKHLVCLVSLKSCDTTKQSISG